MRALNFILAMAALLLAGGTAAPATSVQQTQPAAIDVRVDSRVELLSIVFRLAGNPEYNMANSRSAYSEDVEKQFGPFRQHAVVLEAERLRRQHGVSYDAVMSMAVHLEMDDEMIPRLRAPLEPRPPQLEKRWTQADAAQFVEKLAAFARESDFAGFINKHRDFHAQATKALSDVVNSRPIVPWFDRFFGTRQGSRYVVFVGLLNGGGNYGVSFRNADGTGEEITPIIGVWKWSDAGLPVMGDELLDTIVHEFAHTYTNAAVDRFAQELTPAGDKLFAAHQSIMQRQAYGGGRTVLYESLVRACVIRFIGDNLGQEAEMKQVADEVGRGFRWAPGLAALLSEYQKDRARYPTFDDFMPRVAEFFDKLAAEAQAAAAKAPTVVSIEPANGAQDVDPATAELVVTFDRSMRDGSWAIVRVSAGEFPEIGKPQYDAARRVLRVPMKLEPGKTYRFWLNQGRFMSFVSADGMPLEPVEVTFRTRS